MMSISLNNIAIQTHGTDCCCINSRISKSETSNVMQNIDLAEKSGQYKL